MRGEIVKEPPYGWAWRVLSETGVVVAGSPIYYSDLTKALKAFRSYCTKEGMVDLGVIIADVSTKGELL